MTSSSPHTGFLVIAKTIGITAPAIYTGITYAYTSIIVPPLLHSPPSLLAKQWLLAYQRGPTFVPQLVLSSIFFNTYLSYCSPHKFQKFFYILATIGTASIIPYTALYMEPGINGAGKWKAESLLKDEGIKMEEGQGVGRHTASKETRVWAEGTEMREIVRRWGVISGWRYVLMGIATLASGVATNWPWTFESR